MRADILRLRSSRCMRTGSSYGTLRRATFAVEPAQSIDADSAIEVRSRRVPSHPRPRERYTSKSEDVRDAERYLRRVLGGRAGEERSGSVSEIRSAALGVLQACARRGEVLRLEAWLRVLSDVASVPFGVRHGNSALLACSRAADPQRAESWLFEMIGRCVEPNIYSFNIVIGACAEAADAPLASKWFDRMNDAGMAPDASTYRSAMAAAARSGNAPLAEEWFGRMRAASFPPDDVSCSTIVRAYEVSGDAEGAVRALDAMLREGVRPGRPAFDAAIRAWTNAAGVASPTDPPAEAAPPPTEDVARCLERAEAWFWKALEADVEPSDSAVVTLACTLARLDDAAATRRILEARKRLGRPVSTSAFAALAWQLAACGDVEGVLALLEELRGEGARPDGGCLRALLAACARAPKPPKQVAEWCFGELRRLRSGEALRTDVYDDLRLSVGTRRADELTAEAGAVASGSRGSRATPPPAARPQRARVVGRWEAIAPCE
eukprot:TRINITY_DN33417_c0_g1_i1.p1 TRINITY_DN33417_c0_g1~~TRINITY_DN33417_c0_g1_i1.p1  ORF type:complete len:494 (+),score=110.61 TRINITY_DN33417_c0_g1_i1:29-1510(+)